MTAQPTTHIVKAFDDDLEQLRATVAELGGWAEAEGPIRLASKEAEAAYDALYQSSMAAMIAHPQGSASTANLLFAAQSLAKVAGLAAEIAKLVHFAATGRSPPVGCRIESSAYVHS